MGGFDTIVAFYAVVIAPKYMILSSPHQPQTEPVNGGAGKEPPR